MFFGSMVTDLSATKHTKYEIYTYNKHIQRLRGSRYAHSDYITPQVLQLARGPLRAGTRTSLASLAAATARENSAEARAEAELKLLMKPLIAG